MNRKGYAYSIIIFVMFLGILTYSYFSISGEYEILDEDEDVRTLGVYQSAVLNTIKNAEADLLYLDQSAKYAVSDALKDLNKKGTSFSEAPDGTLSVSYKGATECGMFVYPKWSNEEKFCAPSSPLEAYTNFLELELNSKMSSNLNVPLSDYTFEINELGDSFVIQGTPESEILSEIIITNAKSHGKQKINFGDSELIWPVRGEENPLVTSCYGKRELGDGMHDGIDFASNTPFVVAVADGEVVQKCTSQTGNTYNGGAEPVCGHLGNYFLIKHDKFYTRYSHLSPVQLGSFEVGDQISKGQRLGTVGNTGYSTGAHLDFKIYTTSETSRDKGRDPLCFYSADKLAELRVSPSANSCARKYDNQVMFRREVVQEHCPNVVVENDEDESILKQRGIYEKKGGNYSVKPFFQVETDLPIPVNEEKNEVVNWAEDTWESCVEDPENCISGSIDDYNERGKSNYSLTTLSNDFVCEEDLFYTRILHQFLTCMNNGQSECACRMDLSMPNDVKDYEIFVESNVIRLASPGEERRTFDKGISYYSPQPSNPVRLSPRIDIIRKNGETTLKDYSSNSELPISQLTLYKPENDKVVVVADATGEASCVDNRSTFLVCAESEKEFEFERNGETVSETEKVSFALQLRDRKPDSSKIGVDVEEVEESEEDTAQKVKDQAIQQGLSLLGINPALVSFINTMFLEPKEAAMQVVLDVPEGEDISGFEVYCQAQTPLGNVDISNSDGVFVSTENSYVNQVRDDVQQASKLDFDVEKVDSRVDADDDCEYVTLKTPSGAIEFARKINAQDLGDRKSFMMNSCGGDSIQKLASGISKYCVTLVPVDENGNRGEPIETCQSFGSLTDRVLEELGLAEVKNSYMKVKKGAEGVARGIRNEDYTSVIEYVPGASDTLDKAYEIKKNVTEKMSMQTVRDAIDEAQIDIKNTAKTALDEAQKTEMIEQFMDNTNTLSQVKDDTVEGLKEAIDVESKREFLLKTAGKLEDITVRAKNEFVDDMLKHASTFSTQAKINILRNAREASGSVDYYVNKIHNENLNYNALAEQRDIALRNLNELGLTEYQTSDVLNKLINGEIGISAQKEVLKEAIRTLSDIQVTSTFELVTTFNWDYKIREDLKDEIRNLPQTAKTKIYDKVIDESNAEEVKQMLKNANDVVVKDVYDYMYDTYTDEIVNSIKSAKDDFFHALKCAQNPWDNIRIESASS